MVNLRRINEIAQRIIRDKKYRNLIISRLTQETKRAAKPATSAKKVSINEQNFLKTLKIGFIGGCELSFIKEFLESNGASCYHTFDHNEASDPFLAITNESNGIYKFKPDILVISDAQNIRNYIANIQNGQATFDQQEDELDELKNKIKASVKKLHETLKIPVIVMNYALEIRPAHGRFAYKSLEGAWGVREFINKMDLVYYELSKSIDDLYLLSIEEAFLNAGTGYQIREADANGIYEHITREGAVTVALALLDHLKVIKNFGKRIKCVVVDLDNTLWDGILRDDGVEGINLHKNRLKVLELFTKRGIILAIASKNDSSIEPLIDEILGKYADLFAVKKITWNDKAQSLQEIAQELNIGIDSLAFFDDNPYERDQIRAFLPDVLVLPETEILHALNRLEFEPTGKLTKESAKRAKMYVQQKKREQAEQKFYNKEAFLHSIDLEVWMRPAQLVNMGRVTELIQRTNQLNATAIRYTKQEIQEFYESEEYEIYVANLWDKYGEYGLIGVALVHLEPESWKMEVLTFSCRAMGKTVEQTFLIYLMNEARKRKASKLIGKYRKTDRNEAIERIFTDSNFEKTNTDGNFVFWEYDMKEKGIPKYPDWFDMLKKEK